MNLAYQNGYHTAVISLVVDLREKEPYFCREDKNSWVSSWVERHVGKEYSTEKQVRLRLGFGRIT